MSIDPKFVELTTDLLEEKIKELQVKIGTMGHGISGTAVNCCCCFVGEKNPAQTHGSFGVR